MSPGISPEAPIQGGCYCGKVSYQLTAPPTLSAYCHCSQCQRLTACPFIHTIHFPASAFSWTHATHDLMAADPPVGMHAFQNPAKPHKTRFRCADCGGQVVSRNLDTQAVSVWGAQLQRGADGRIERWAEVRPTAHIFYDTRMLDVDDGLGKWDGYEGRSQRIA